MLNIRFWRDCVFPTLFEYLNSRRVLPRNSSDLFSFFFLLPFFLHSHRNACSQILTRANWDCCTHWRTSKGLNIILRPRYICMRETPASLTDGWINIREQTISRVTVGVHMYTDICILIIWQFRCTGPDVSCHSTYLSRQVNTCFTPRIHIHTYMYARRFSISTSNLLYKIDFADKFGRFKYVTLRRRIYF